MFTWPARWDLIYKESCFFFDLSRELIIIKSRAIYNYSIRTRYVGKPLKILGTLFVSNDCPLLVDLSTAAKIVLGQSYSFYSAFGHNRAGFPPVSKTGPSGIVKSTHANGTRLAELIWPRRPDQSDFDKLINTVILPAVKAITNGCVAPILYILSAFNRLNWSETCKIDVTD